MPLHSVQHLGPRAVLGLWHRSELPADLWPLLPQPVAYHALRPHTAVAERQAQWLAGRVLVHALLAELLPASQTDFVLHNAPSGRPWLAGAIPGPAVSLSHSGEWLAAIVALDGRVGVDIELVRDKARRIAAKFLSPLDLKNAEAQAALAADAAAHYSLLWSAKETLYKLADRINIHFKTQLLLHDFQPEMSGEIPATLLFEDSATRHLVCYTSPAPGYVLTYCYEPGPIPIF